MTQPTCHRPRTLPAGCLAVAVALAMPAAGQGTIRHVADKPLMTVSVEDIPGLLAALERTRLGTLAKDPATIDALDTVVERWRAKIRVDLALTDKALRLAPEILDQDELFDRWLWRTDWRDLESLEATVFAPGETPWPQSILAARTNVRAEGRLLQQFDELARELADHPNLRLAEEQKALDLPATVYTWKDTEDVDEHMHAFRPEGLVRGCWFVHLPGQFVAGTGAPAGIGEVATVADREPSAELVIDVTEYFGMFERQIGGMGAGMPPELAHFLDGSGLRGVRDFVWRLRPAGEWLDETLAVTNPDDFAGLLGALAGADAALVDQPLPEGALLQLRLALQVEAALAAFDELAMSFDLPGLDEQLKAAIGEAWTGGLTVGLCAPARGGVVPRIYLSLGSADDDAMRALMARFVDGEAVQDKAVEYGGLPCTQLRISGAPPAVQPAWTIAGGVLHLAESARSLRDLAEARAAGAPAAMAVDDAALPPLAATGRQLPGFDLRFDGAAIYRAVHETWRPLLLAATAGGADEIGTPFLDAQDMPDVETVTAALTPGRGVLSLDDHTLKITMRSAAGGPHANAMLTAFPTMFSDTMTGSGWSRRYRTSRLATHQMESVAAAIAAWQGAHETPPPSLGALVAAGLDPELLLVPGDDTTEPVLHEGKEVARSAFRYCAPPVTVDVDGNDVEVVLIRIRPGYYDRLLLDVGGHVHTPYGESANESVDELVGKKD